MRCSTSSRIPVAAFALLAIGALAGLAPAEARGPVTPAPRGKDTIAPTITCPSGITVDQKAIFGAGVSFSVSATDNKDPAPRVTASPASGSVFPVGTTTVTVTATDWKGNTSKKTFDVVVRPAVVPTAYKAYWTDSDGYVDFEWDITVAADGTVSGSGHQVALLLVYDQYNQYGDIMPPGLSGAGVVSGAISANATGQFESSTTYWVWNAFEYDADGNRVYRQNTRGFSGSVNVGVDSYGTLWFSPDPLASPGFWGDGYWIPQ